MDFVEKLLRVAPEEKLYIIFNLMFVPNILAYEKCLSQRTADYISKKFF